MRKLTYILLLVTGLSAGEVYATFNVLADKSANMAFDASGIVKQVNADISSVVKKGDVLAVLENSDIKAQLDNAKTTLKFAKLDYERQLKIKDLIDASKFDKYALKYESAKNQVAYQQALYNKTFLRAPFNGVIFFKEIEVGDTVSGMMLKTVFKIQNTKQRKLVLEFDQKYNQVVKAGQKFKYTIDGDPHHYEGKISKIYPRADNETRKIKAEVIAKGLMVGLFGSGTIITDTKE